ncbi:pseudomurein-binding repeat-containing protein [Methanobacterium sp.]|uniref:pseudomurein-binding repeat-containing protein n=1 Tax=Methanobacterium sp. TaxID=2164 RepID=UPI003C72EDA9
MFCPKCGTKNDEDAEFCEKCGINLNDDSGITKENAGLPVKFLIAICIVLVAGLGIAAGYIFQGHGAASNSSQTQNNVISQSTGFPLSETPVLAAEIAKNNGNSENVQYQGVTLDKNQCLYILSKAIVMLNSGKTGNIPIKTFGDANDPCGNLNSASITKEEYVDMADRTYTWMDANGRAPNHTGIKSAGSSDLTPDMTLKSFAKVLTEYKATGQLPASISI